MAPYVATDVVSYRCVDNFAAFPERTEPTCTCTATGGGATASWGCNPATADLPTTCRPGKRLLVVNTTAFDF